SGTAPPTEGGLRSQTSSRSAIAGTEVEAVAPSADEPAPVWRESAPGRFWRGGDSGTGQDPIGAEGDPGHLGQCAVDAEGVRDQVHRDRWVREAEGTGQVHEPTRGIDTDVTRKGGGRRGVRGRPNPAGIPGEGAGTIMPQLHRGHEQVLTRRVNGHSPELEILFEADVLRGQFT